MTPKSTNGTVGRVDRAIIDGFNASTASMKQLRGGTGCWEHGAKHASRISTSNGDVAHVRSHDHKPAQAHYGKLGKLKQSKTSE